MYVDLEAVYPNIDDQNDEFSFEETRARLRGWIGREWEREPPRKARIGSRQPEYPESKENTETTFSDPSQQDVMVDIDNTASDVAGTREERNGKPKRKKVMEIKGETQTGMFVWRDFHSTVGPGC